MNECRKMLASGWLRGAMMCVSCDGKDTCQGDSGGNLLKLIYFILKLCSGPLVCKLHYWPRFECTLTTFHDDKNGRVNARPMKSSFQKMFAPVDLRE